MNFQQFMDFIRSEKARLFEIENEKKKAQEAEAKRLADLAIAEAKGKEEKQFNQLNQNSDAYKHRN